MEIKKFKDLKESDVILGADNKPVRLSEAYKEHIPERMYKLTTSAGTTVNTSGNHLWYVELQVDKALHKRRLRTGKKVFKNIDKSSLELLYEMAEENPLPIDTSLIDMVDLVDGSDSAMYALYRIAESLGPISEDTFTGYDAETSEEYSSLVPAYDGRRFAQQILSLRGKREDRKLWPVIVGRVVTTDELVNIYETAELP